jgi:hypothetical protein
MSEPMSRGEIEDVLSSIRRLVSEDLRPPLRAGTPPAPPADKLILTPALRVVDEDAVPETTVPGWSLVAEAEAAPDQGDASASETSDDAGDAVHLRVASIAAAVEPPAAQPWESETGDPWSAGGDGGDVAILSRVIAGGGPDPVHAEGSGDAEAHSPEPVHEDAADEPAAEPEPAAAEEILSGQPEEAPSIWSEAEASEPAFSAEAAPDAAEAPFPDADAAAAPPPDAPSFRHRTATDPFDRYDDPEDAGPLDTEVLRDLIRDVVREELQGPMGERITRNLRKLVRAELQRMLAARDFG